MPNYYPDEISRSELYEEIGSRAVPGPYDDVWHLRCPICHAGVNQKCVNPITGRTRKLPCIGRKERRA
jgi:hypothetical protein